MHRTVRFYVLSSILYTTWTFLFRHCIFPLSSTYSGPFTVRWFHIATGFSQTTICSSSLIICLRSSSTLIQLGELYIPKTQPKENRARKEVLRTSVEEKYVISNSPGLPRPMKSIFSKARPRGSMTGRVFSIRIVEQDIFIRGGAEEKYDQSRSIKLSPSSKPYLPRAEADGEYDEANILGHNRWVECISLWRWRWEIWQPVVCWW